MRSDYDLSRQTEQGRYEMEVILGVVAGVVTSALLWLAKNFWSCHIEPYLTRIRYRGVDVSGDWTAIEVADHYAVRFSINIVQSAHTISGVGLLEYYSEKNEFRVIQDCAGELWEGYISFRFKPADRKITSYSVSLLKIAGGGTRLEGGHLYRNVNSEAVDNATFTFIRGPGEPRAIIGFNEAAARLQALNLAARTTGRFEPDPSGIAAPGGAE